MKNIGLIGGMSWESSAEYYRLINQETKLRLGGQHNAPSVLVTVDFAAVEQLQHAGQWDELGAMLTHRALQLERAGADFVVLCTNTMHKLADCIIGSVQIPLLHIADAVGQAVQLSGQRRVGLLGTRFTMEQTFYSDRLRQNFGIETVVPPSEDRKVVHDVIYNELCHGLIRDESRIKFQDIIARLAERGAECVILGCTEIGLLISQKDSILPAHDSTRIHAIAAVEFALA
ncbi:MAG TPA: aspartate/glutamate racemase family protein [Bryobacteraceae bacterium]|nr:aspartate/glutamate racemase family protein [Bryobacteraceae bacterium]